MCEDDTGDEDDVFAFIGLECRRCGTDMIPVALASGMAVLRCPRCGLVTI